MGLHLKDVPRDALSPMMRQFAEIKDQYADCLILFRLGDFYETFFEDAELTAQVLEIALTSRDCGLEERAPMAGVPHHAIEQYLTLLDQGYKVALVEQMEDPKSAKGLVQREVVRCYARTLTEQGLWMPRRIIISWFCIKSRLWSCFLRTHHGRFQGTALVQSDDGEAFS